MQIMTVFLYDVLISRILHWQLGGVSKIILESSVGQPPGKIALIGCSVFNFIGKKRYWHLFQAFNHDWRRSTEDSGVRSVPGFCDCKERTGWQFERLGITLNGCKLDAIKKTATHRMKE
jgi:hypothetical protein